MYKRVVLVGFGRFGKILARELIQQGVLVGIVHPRREEVSGHVDQNIFIFKTHTEITISVDLVIIATPPDSHFAIARYFLERYIPVFIEKPMTTSYDDAQKLIDIATKNNVFWCTDMIFLYRPEWRILKSIEKISSISFQWCKYGTFRDPIAYTLMYHDMYLLADMFGPARMHHIHILGARAPEQANRFDIIEFSCMYQDILVQFKYDRLSSESYKSIELYEKNIRRAKWISDKVYINSIVNTYTPQDAMHLMMNDVLSGIIQPQHALYALSAIENVEYIQKEIKKIES